MSMLQPFAKNPRYLKAGFLGFGGSGKTYTAAELAIGLHRYFELQGPIAAFDTERGLAAQRERIEEHSGVPLVGTMSRSFEDLMVFCEEVDQTDIRVVIIDSVTHVWRRLCKDMLDAINRDLRERYKERARIRKKLEFQDWAPVKDRWQVFTEWFLNSRAHVLICGRAGFEYDFQVDDRKNRELVKTDVKMKAEGEFTYEPGVVVMMQRETDLDPSGLPRNRRRATIIKDRSDLIDGETALDPTWRFFEPVLEWLRAGDHAPIDRGRSVGFRVDMGADEWQREQRQRAILAEEIKGELVAAHPGQSADAKKAKADLLLHCFQTRSWKKIESTPSAALKSGLATLRAELGVEDPEPPFDDREEIAPPPEPPADIDELPGWAGGEAGEADASSPEPTDDR